ncbi:hypothetical protein Lal_00022764 [Lupinus albus]|nr:hypothetical protein Lal_00022764 [Lupinus albus]
MGFATTLTGFHFAVTALVGLSGSSMFQTPSTEHQREHQVIETEEKEKFHSIRSSMRTKWSHLICRREKLRNHTHVIAAVAGDEKPASSSFFSPSCPPFSRLLTLFFPKSSITKIKRKWITLRFAAERSFENGRGSETDPSEMKTGVIPAERTHDSLPFRLRTSPSSSHFLRLLTSLLKIPKAQMKPNLTPPPLNLYKVCMLPHTLPQHTRVTHTYALYPEQGDWVLFKPTFALAIYGVVLFPFVYDMVDQAAIDVFTKFKKFLVNPVPAVLAETLLSFQMCHERGVHKVRCCIQLLYVWMMTRFKHHQYPDWSRYPLRRFRKIAINPMQLSDWKKIFVEITPRNFGTKCGLYDRHPEIMYSCGDFTNMMLMGPRGCITFNPALILGQLKWGMMPVPSELLQGSMVWYKDGETSKETLISIRNALKRIRLYEKKELGNTNLTIPLKKELLQANQIRLLEAKLEEARNEIEKYGFSVEKLDKIIETQKKEHTSLKRDYASMCSTSEKIPSYPNRKEKDKKIAELIKMNEEKDEQISNMSHQLKAREAKAESLQALAQDTKNEESHAWATMKEYQAALEKTLEREDQLKTIMKEMEKAHHQALAEANNDKVYLSEQLSLLEATHDELVTRQQEWVHNWDHMLQECKWTRIDARGELQMYPETELRPTMRAFYETCDQLAWKLRKWRIACN